jgi:hypothetical protein
VAAFIGKMPKFLKFSVGSWLRVVKAKGCCLVCFSQYHFLKDCEIKLQCSKCKLRRNELLCFANWVDSSSKFEAKGTAEQQQQNPPLASSDPGEMGKIH